MPRLPKQNYPDIERIIEFDFVRATEAAALNSLRWLGRGEKEKADAAACDAMRGMFDLMNICGEVVTAKESRTTPRESLKANNSAPGFRVRRSSISRSTRLMGRRIFQRERLILLVVSRPPVRRTGSRLLSGTFPPFTCRSSPTARGSLATCRNAATPECRWPRRRNSRDCCARRRKACPGRCCHDARSSAS